MDGVMHIESIMSASWCGWTMLALLLCAVAAEFFQPGVITQAPTALLVRTERVYKAAPTNFLGQLFVTLFRIGTPAMALCLCFSEPGHASFTVFWAVCGLIVGVWMMKMLCNLLLDYTFTLRRQFGEAYEPYGNLVTLVTLAMYPAVLVLLRVGNAVAAQWTIGILAAIFLLTVIYRTLRTYLVSLSAVLYLILYIVTLEVLPIVLLIYFSTQTINIL